MSINLKIPDIRELKPRITVFGVGGAGGNAVNNMIAAGLQGVDFVVANTDAQALTLSKAERIIQMGVEVTQGLGAGARPDVGRAAAEEVMDEIRDHLSGAHMVFVTAGMGGGTGTGATPVVAKVARDLGILTVGVVTKPFHFEGVKRMQCAEAGIAELQKVVDTLIIIPNQNLFRVANEKTTFAAAFAMADQVLYSGVACITDLMVKEGLINLDFADVRTVMQEMGKAMMGTGEANGEKRALRAAEAAISNPLIDDVSMRGARGLLISITGGKDLTLYEVDEAATRIREEVDAEANIIVGATFDESLDGVIRVSVVATGVDEVAGTRQLNESQQKAAVANHESRIAELTQRLRADTQRMQERVQRPEARTLAQPQPAAPTLAETAATAAVAEALEGVTIKPMAPMPTLLEPAPAHAAPAPAEPAMPKVFIPPRPEPMANRPPRMPRIDEFPPHAQNAMRASQGQPAEAAEAEAEKPRSLLKRLAAVGLGRREEHHEPLAERQPARVQMPPLPERPIPRPTQPRPMEARQEPVSEYAKRGTPQGLDQHGRPLPAVHNPGNPSDDDQLEIPAFLRRQAN
ncbi:MAG TPA: cell division protein FtsZ [Xanthobacteraceae bacterium]